MIILYKDSSGQNRRLLIAGLSGVRYPKMQCFVLRQTVLKSLPRVVLLLFGQWLLRGATYDNNIQTKHICKWAHVVP